MYLYGANSHGKIVAEIAEESGYRIHAYIDGDVSKKKMLDYSLLHKPPQENIDVVISIANTRIRKNIVDQNTLFSYMTLLHPKSSLSGRIQIEEGTVVMPGVTINAAVTVGKHCVINTNSSIDHDCVLKDFVHISPNAALGGSVYVGKDAHLGVGENIIQGIEIGK